MEGLETDGFEHLVPREGAAAGPLPPGCLLPAQPQQCVPGCGHPTVCAGAQSPRHSVCSPPTVCAGAPSPLSTRACRRPRGVKDGVCVRVCVRVCVGVQAPLRPLQGPSACECWGGLSHRTHCVLGRERDPRSRGHRAADAAGLPRGPGTAEGSLLGGFSCQGEGLRWQLLGGGAQRPTQANPGLWSFSGRTPEKPPLLVSWGHRSDSSLSASAPDTGLDPGVSQGAVLSFRGPLPAHWGLLASGQAL